jgi:hypothetical protein
VKKGGKRKKRNPDDYDFKNYVRNPNFDKPVITYLKKWILSNLDTPYPTQGEKERLCRTTGLSMKQLQIWLTNSRKRIVDPIIKEKKKFDKGIIKTRKLYSRLSDIEALKLEDLEAELK